MNKKVLGMKPDRYVTRIYQISVFLALLGLIMSVITYNPLPEPTATSPMLGLFSLLGMIIFIMALLGWTLLQNSFSKMQQSHMGFVVACNLLYFVIGLAVSSIIVPISMALNYVVAIALSLLYLACFVASFLLYKEAQPFDTNAMVDEIKKLKTTLATKGLSALK